MPRPYYNTDTIKVGGELDQRSHTIRLPLERLRLGSELVQSELMKRQASQTRALLDGRIYVGSHAQISISLVISLSFMLIEARRPIK